jgi:enamine deaminase RidA (YjgF/YER057c/UK114 family)
LGASVTDLFGALRNATSDGPTMPRFINPPTLPDTGGRYSQGVLHARSGKRLLISGQVGRQSDGTMAEGLEAQTLQALDNVLACVTAAEMKITDIVKMTIFCTQKGGVAAVREARLKTLGRHAPASTYIEVAGLADPAYLIEIEGEAVRED